MLRFIGFYDYTVILTYMSLFSAICGILLSSKGELTGAILCLLLSGFCDMFDGMVARSKKNRTDDEKAFGIQLDSLCDVVSFGISPAIMCYHMGMNGPIGIACMFLYSMCAVIRLAFFNVIEGKRQQTEAGCNKTYRGLPVTTASIILPVFYCFRFILPQQIFVIVLHIVIAVTAFLFILDFSVKKPDWQKILTGKK